MLSSAINNKEWETWKLQCENIQWNVQYIHGTWKYTVKSKIYGTWKYTVKSKIYGTWKLYGEYSITDLRDGACPDSHHCCMLEKGYAEIFYG